MAKAKAVTSPPRGTRDFLPIDVYRRELVTKVIRETYEAHGFEPLETPTFERLETLLGKYGEEGDQLVFKILHRGQPLVTGIRDAAKLITTEGAVLVGRSGETAPGAEKLLADMGLRYDLTVPLARVYAEYQGKLPPVFKRYQIQPVWRADTPGKGRFREFYQCDVDIVGSSELVVEAEVAGAVSRSLEKLGFEDFEVRLNHRGLLRAFVEVAGIDLAKETEAIVAIDKLDKIGESGVLAELEAKGIGEESRKKLLQLVIGDGTGNADPAKLRELVGTHEKGLAALRDLEKVLELGALTPAAKHLRFNTTLARGLGYYTGCIFEIAVKDLAGSLGGGGRYDGLIGMFSGKEVPACGFSLGLERILVVMDERKMFPAVAGGVDVLVAATDDVALPRALSIAYTLRAAGLKAELVSKVDKPGRVRKAADDRAIRAAVLVEREPTDAVKLWLRAEPEVTDRVVPTAELAARLVS
ncbi:histidine--tRNA ligase [Myxococcota bacterium]|nr:histidine--tRNA ligase [Myxococcota bacterium]